MFQLRQVDTIEKDVTLYAIVELQETSSGGGFPAAAFTYQPEGFASLNIEANTINRLDIGYFFLQDAGCYREPHFQVFYINKMIAITHSWKTLSCPSISPIYLLHRSRHGSGLVLLLREPVFPHGTYQRRIHNADGMNSHQGGGKDSVEDL